MKINKLWAGLLLLSLLQVGCPAPNSVYTPETPVSVALEKDIRIEFAFMDQNDNPIILKTGAAVKIYKEQTLLATAPIQMIDEISNSIQIDPVKVAPPYRYEIEAAVINEIQPDRIIPIGGQAGIIGGGDTLTPIGGQGGLNPEELNNNTNPLENRTTTEAKDRPLQAGDTLKISGDITTDLQKANPEVRVEKALGPKDRKGS